MVVVEVGRLTEQFGPVGLHLTTGSGDELLNVLSRDSQLLIVEDEGCVGDQQLLLLSRTHVERHCRGRQRTKNKRRYNNNNNKEDNTSAQDGGGGDTRGCTLAGKTRLRSSYASCRGGRRARREGM